MIWKPVGIKNYHASSEGQIARLIDGEYVLKSVTLNKGNGYLHTGMCVDGKRKRPTVHYLVAKAFLGERPENFVINHKNGVKTDNRPDNLEYVTRSQNSKHAYDMGLTPKPVFTGTHVCGEDHSKAKITEEMVQAILKSSDSYGKLGIKYRMSRFSIRDIKKRKTWKHVVVHSPQ